MATTQSDWLASSFSAMMQTPIQLLVVKHQRSIILLLTVVASGLVSWCVAQHNTQLSVESSQPNFVLYGINLTPQASAAAQTTATLPVPMATSRQGENLQLLWRKAGASPSGRPQQHHDQRQL